MSANIDSLDNRPPASRGARRFRWIMTVVWAGLIFYLSTSGFGVSFTTWLLSVILGILHLTVSPATFALLHEAFRKLAHLTEYGIFSLLIYASLLGTIDFEWRPRLALRAVVIAALYSLTDEYHQSFVTGRTPTIVDCGIDTAGAALATLIPYAWDRLRQGRPAHTKIKSTAASAASAAPAAKGTPGV
ncbi:MAG TPA: VanZ family protein [Terriglobia bacterium]|nr:VanZ family protein [Terriglobia bacterium]